MKDLALIRWCSLFKYVLCMHKFYVFSYTTHIRPHVTLGPLTSLSLSVNELSRNETG